MTKSEPILNEIDGALRAAESKLNARAGKKEGGWGEGIFARPRFPPPPNFVFRFAKCAAKELVKSMNICFIYNYPQQPPPGLQLPP